MKLPHRRNRHEVTILCASLFALIACSSGSEPKRTLLSGDTGAASIEDESEKTRLQDLQAFSVVREITDENGEYFAVGTTDLRPRGNRGFLEYTPNNLNPYHFTGGMSEFLDLTCGFPVQCSVGQPTGDPVCYAGAALFIRPETTCQGIEPVLRYTDDGRATLPRVSCALNVLLSVAEERAEDVSFPSLDDPEDGVARLVVPALEASQRPAVYLVAFDIAMRQMSMINAYLGGGTGNLDCDVPADFAPPIDLAEPDGPRHPPRLFLARRFMELYRFAQEAAEGYVESTVQVADAQYGTTLSPEVAQERVFMAQSLSRGAAAAFLVGINTSLFESESRRPFPTTLGLPPLNAEGQEAETLLRLAAPPLAILDAAVDSSSGHVNPDVVFGFQSAPGVAQEDTVIYRLEALFHAPEGWAEDQTYTVLDTSREGARLAIEKLLRWAEVYDSPAGAYDEVNGVLRYAATSVADPQRPEEFWLSRLNAQSIQSAPPYLTQLLDGTRVGGLAQLEELAADTSEVIGALDFVDDIDDTLSGQPELVDEFTEEAQQLVRLADDTDYEIIEVLREDSGFIPSSVFEPSPNNLIFVPSTETELLLCASEGHVDHFECPEPFDWEEELDTGSIGLGYLTGEGNYRYYESTFNDTGWSSGLPGYYVLRRDCIDQECTSYPGQWDVVAYVHSTTYTSALALQPTVNPALSVRAGSLLIPDPDRTNRPLIECATGGDGTGIFDRRIPLENSLNSDGDPLESSWRTYLQKARDAANEADTLAQVYLDARVAFERETIAQEEKERLRDEKANSAIERVYQYCGDEHDYLARARTEVETGVADTTIASGCFDGPGGESVRAAVGDQPICACSGPDCPRVVTDVAACDDPDNFFGTTLGLVETETVPLTGDPCQHIRKVRTESEQYDASLLARTPIESRASNLHFEATPEGYSHILASTRLIASTDPDDELWPCERNDELCDDLEDDPLGFTGGSYMCSNLIDCGGSPFEGDIPHANGRLFRMVMDAQVLAQEFGTHRVPFQVFDTGSGDDEGPPSDHEMWDGTHVNMLISDRRGRLTLRSPSAETPVPLFAWSGENEADLYLYTSDASNEHAGTSFRDWRYQSNPGDLTASQTGLTGGIHFYYRDAQSVELDLTRESFLVQLLTRSTLGGSRPTQYADWNGAEPPEDFVGRGPTEWPFVAPLPDWTDRVDHLSLDPDNRCISEDVVRQMIRSCLDPPPSGPSLINPPSLPCPVVPEEFAASRGIELCDTPTPIWSAYQVTSEDQLDALELLCVNSHSVSTCPSDLPPATDVNATARYFECRGEEMTENVARMVVIDLPPELVTSDDNERLDVQGGAVEQEIITARQTLRTMVRQLSSVGQIIRALGVATNEYYEALNGVDLAGQQADLNFDVAELGVFNQCVNSISVGGGGGGGVVGAVVGALVGAAKSGIGCGSAVKSWYHAKSQRALSAQNEINARGNAVRNFHASVDQLAYQLELASEALATAADEFTVALSRIETQRAAARRAFEEAKWHLSGPSERELQMSQFLRNRSRGERQRYRRALRRAKRAAFLAKRAIEQRLGERLEELTTDLPLVSAPSKWESELCSLEAIRYNELRDARRGQVRNLYVNRHIGDYVTRLENLIESYRLQYPFSEGEDMIVASLRDDVLGVRKSCEQEAPNLLKFTEDMTQAVSGRPDFPRWYFDGCEDCPVVSLAEGNEALEGLPPEARSYVTTAPGSLIQDVLLDEGLYRLSWYTADEIDVNPIVDEEHPDDPDNFVPLEVMEQNVDNIEGTDTVRQWAVVQTTNQSNLRIGLAFNGPVDSEVPFGGVMLERVEDGLSYLLAQPGLFFPTDESTTAYLATCPDTGGESFRRDHFRYACESLCPSGFADSCGSVEAREYCYHETCFASSQARLDSGRLFSASGFAVGNFNYRIDTLGLNFVGTGLHGCEASESPESCYASGYVPFSLEHRGPFQVRSYTGEVASLDLFDGFVERGRGLAAERYLTNPLSSSDAELIGQFLRYEFAGRPLDGNFCVKVWDSPGFNFDQIEDVQLVLKYRYWTRSL